MNPLFISEILDCIIKHLEKDAVRDPTNDYPKGRWALATLARTCRAFSEPALDALWSRLDSLEPFVLCLPKRAPLDDTTADGTLPVFDDEEWSIVLRYAARVRELRLNDYERHPKLSLKVLRSLWFRTTLLLPNLRKLHWVYRDYTEITLIRLLLSPSLTDLRMLVDKGDHTTIMGLLDSYHTLCPNLRSLYFGYTHAPPHLLAAVSRAITRSPNLENLDCSSIDEATLAHFASFHCLKRFSALLEFHHPDNLTMLTVNGDPNHPPFENLCVLRLHIQNLSSIIPIFKSHRQPFEEVEVTIYSTCPTLEVLYEFFTALGSTVRQKTLRRIGLCTFGASDPGMPLHAINFQILRLLTIFNLHAFSIDLTSPVTLTDDELVHLVQSWPDLETFGLNILNGWGHHGTSHIPTLKGLLRVTERCPKLCDLALCIDARDIPSLSDDESSICSTTVTELLFASDSLIHTPVANGVAQFLLEHFPSLRNLSMRADLNYRLSHDNQPLWRPVGTLFGGES